MAVLIVEEVTEVRDVVELITYLAGVLASGNTDGLLGDGTFTLTRLASPTPISCTPSCGWTRTRRARTHSTDPGAPASRTRRTPTHGNRRSWKRPGMKGPFPT